MKCKILLLTALMLCPLFLLAQKNIQPTDAIEMVGLEGQSSIITLDSIEARAGIQLDSFVITNHLGERKSALRHLRLVPLLPFLSRIQLPQDNPRDWSTYYFVFEASDHYKVLYSWNEIFNTPTGKEIYLITEKDGKKIRDLNDRIAVVCLADQMTGRRYVKSLSKILLKRAE